MLLHHFTCVSDYKSDTGYANGNEWYYCGVDNMNDVEVR